MLSFPIVLLGSGQKNFFNPFFTLGSPLDKKGASPRSSKPEKKAQVADSVVPFRPPSNLMGECINKYPIAEMPKEGRKNEVLQMLEEEEKGKQHSGPQFKPSGTSKS
jgi:hypothetical protein